MFCLRVTQQVSSRAGTGPLRRECMSAEKLGLMPKHLLWEGQDDAGSSVVMSLGYLSEPSPIWSQCRSSGERQAVRKT